MGDLDRGHACLVECGNDAADLLGGDAVTDGVHTVTKGHILHEDVGGAHSWFSFFCAIRSATWSAAEVMMSRLPA
jgi:hypothetical protein